MLARPRRTRVDPAAIAISAATGQSEAPEQRHELSLPVCSRLGEDHLQLRSCRDDLDAGRVRDLRQIAPSRQPQGEARFRRREAKGLAQNGLDGFSVLIRVYDHQDCFRSSKDVLTGAHKWGRMHDQRTTLWPVENNRTKG
jgi:hypothetical protein